MTGITVDIAALAAILSNIILGLVSYMVKRWMDRVDVRLDRFEADSKSCAIGLLSTFRTKEEASAAWAQARREWDDQWTKINDHDRRITRIETVCEREHGR